MTTTEADILADLDVAMLALVPAWTNPSTVRTAGLAGLHKAIARAVSHYAPATVAGVGVSETPTVDTIPKSPAGSVLIAEGWLGSGAIDATKYLRGDRTWAALDADLVSVAGLATAGIPVRISSSSWVTVSIDGTASEIEVTNGDGTGGNPTIGLADNPIVPGTEGLTLPAGDDGQRPGSPADGSNLRYNTGSTYLEYAWHSTWIVLATQDWATALFQPLDSDLTAIAALSTTGRLRRTGPAAWDTAAIGYGEITAIPSKRILLNNTASTGAAVAGTITQALDLLTGGTGAATRGSFPYRDATSWGELGIGAAGRVMVSDGTDAAWSRSLTGITPFGILNSGGTYDIRIKSTESLTATRELTIDLVDADRNIHFGGNFQINGATNLGNYDLTFATTASTTLTLPTSGVLATLNNLETFTNKTLTTPDINGGTVDAITSFGLLASGVGSVGDLKMRCTEVLTGNRTITWQVNDANKNVTLGGNITTAASFTTAGAFGLTLTVTGTTNVTLPTTGTLETTDAGITSLKGVDTVADVMAYTTAANTWAALATTAGGRAALGVTYAADKGVYWSSASVAATFDLTAGARAGLALTYAADRGVYWTSASAAAVFTLTAFGRSLVDDATPAAARTTLELEAGAAGDIWVEKAGDTMTGPLVLVAGSATAGSWSKHQAGTLLTVPAVGVLEYDGAAFYQTANATSGREQSVGEHIYRLTADAGAGIGPGIADFFGVNTAISLPASTMWELEAELFFLKSTAGTVTITITTSSAFTSCSGYLEIDAVGGGTGFQATSRANTHGTSPSFSFPATAAITDATNHLFRLKLIFQTNLAANVRIRVTSSLGTVTPKANSMYKVRRIPGNVGTFV